MTSVTAAIATVEEEAVAADAQIRTSVALRRHPPRRRHPPPLAIRHLTRRRERERRGVGGWIRLGEGQLTAVGGVVTSSRAAERAWWSARGREGRVEKEKEEERKREGEKRGGSIVK